MTTRSISPIIPGMPAWTARRALVQVTVQPVALPVAGTQTTAAAAPSDAVTLLADVRW